MLARLRLDVSFGFVTLRLVGRPVQSSTDSHGFVVKKQA